MSRVLSLAGVGASMLAAFALYAVKHETRALEQIADRLETRIEETRSAIAVLEAERANLARPSRIEALARQHLGMGPMEPGQLANLSEVPWREEAAQFAASHSGIAAKEPPEPAATYDTMPALLSAVGANAGPKRPPARSQAAAAAPLRRDPLNDLLSRR